MAKLYKGILGPFSGKIGPVIGSSWKSIPYIKAAPKKSKKKRKSSAKQIAQQQKFKFVSEWLIPFHPYVSIGFLNLSKVQSEINLAFSQNYRNAVTGEYPDFNIDYSKVMISKGQLAPLLYPEVAMLLEDTLQLSWSQSIAQRASYDDQVMLVLYCPELKIADGFVGGTKRSAVQCTFKFNPKMIGLALEVYASVTSISRKKIANSEYMGRVEPL